jgi:class 3 adenylate cyclase/predicted ATPase
MFCDLVGSTALSVRLDAEDLREIILGYLACCEDVAKRFDGYIALCTGDGLVIYFGFPIAAERSAERAVRAGLAIVSAVQALQLRPNLVLQTRIGIASGEVVVDVASKGRGKVQQPTMVGETLHLAARLQALADPDSVVIADTTRRVVGDLFEYFDLGCNSLAGFSEPIQAWRVVRERSVASHFEATSKKAALTPLVDRREELAMLYAYWQAAKAGKGQVVLLSGEPGIGKSRLILALRQQLAEESCTILRYFGSPYHENTSLYPIISQIERAARLAGTDAPNVKLDKLEALLSRSTTEVQRVAPLIASLLSIPSQGRYPSLDLNLRRLKHSTLEVLATHLDGLAANNPVLVLFEDLQWVDPTTQELIGRLAARARQLPVLLLMTCRPEFTPPWDEPHVTRCVLTRLSEPDAKTVVGELSGRKPLPPEVLEQIVMRCDGLPLCLEEMTKTVLEAGYLRDDGDRYTRTIPLPEVVIPETLHDSLLARLDGLGKFKDVARTAAVIGREFSCDLLCAVLPQKDVAKDALKEMIQAGLIMASGETPDATYRFKHALVRDAAYASLLRAERKAQHARLARVLVEEFPETAEREPELVARHFTGAMMVEFAIHYWRKAGEQSLGRFANAEAINHFSSALELLMTVPESVERDQQELDLQICLGTTFTTAKGFAAPEVEIAYTRARSLSQRLADPERVFSVWRGLWVFDLVRAQWQQAYELAAEMLAMSQHQHSSGYQLEAHRAMGVTLFWLGEFVRARDHLKQVHILYEPAQHHAHTIRYGSDPGVASLVHEAYVLWVLGYPDQALARSDEALALARQSNHPFSLAQALLYRGFLHQHRREAKAAESLAKQTETLATEHGFPFWLAESEIVQGWALAQNGETARGVQRLRNGLNDFLATGAEMDRPRWLATLAETYGRNGQPDAGLNSIHEALAAVENTGERFYEARVHELNGTLLLQRHGVDAKDEAEACLLKALSVARQQDAKSWELSAASSLARLWCQQGKRRDARNLLQPVYDWFAEGFDTGDLRDAKALLNGPLN